MTAKGAQTLGSALAVNSSLLSLDLSYNPLGEDGIILLSRPLKKLDLPTNLQYLNLEKTGCQEEGAKHLLDVAKALVSLKEIGLGKKSPDSEISAALRSQISVTTRSKRAQPQKILTKKEKIKFKIKKTLDRVQAVKQKRLEKKNKKN